MQADDSDFAEHLIEAEGPVASFRNIGGDAVLVVPKRISAVDCYAHMAAFVREGPREQQHALFQLVGAEAETLLAPDRSSGSAPQASACRGCHVRLDSTRNTTSTAPTRKASEPLRPNPTVIARFMRATQFSSLAKWVTRIARKLRATG